MKTLANVDNYILPVKIIFHIRTYKYNFYKMHYNSGRFVPNSFLEDQENSQQYSHSKKIKGRIKNKKENCVLSDKSNEQSSPKKLKPLTADKSEIRKIDLTISEDELSDLEIHEVKFPPKKVLKIEKEENAQK